MFRLEDIGENVTNYGNNNFAYTVRCYATAVDDIASYIQMVCPI